VENTPELKLDYPCHWDYKLVMSNEHDLSFLTHEILSERIHTIAKSQESKKGNYTSYTLSVLVHNADDRKMLYQTLKAHKYIKFVL